MWEFLQGKGRKGQGLRLSRVTVVGIGNLGAQGLAFIATLLLAQSMAEADYGIFRTLLSVGMLLGVAIWTGLPNSLIFFGSSADGRPRRSSLTSAAILQSAGLLIIVGIPMALLFESGLPLFLFLLGTACYTVLLNLLRAGLLFRRHALFELLSGAGRVALVATIVVALGWRSPASPLLIMAFGWLVALPAIPRSVLSVLRVDRSMPTREAHRIVASYASTVSVSSGIVATFLNADLLLVSVFQGVTTAAVYGIARTFAVAFSIAPAAIATVLFAEVSARRDIDQARRFLRSGLLILCGVDGVLFLLAAAFAPWLLSWLLPPLYEEAFVPLLLLGIAAIAYGAVYLWASVLTAQGYPTKVLTLLAVLLPIDLIAVGIGAWQWGAGGTAAGSALAMLIGMAIFTVAGRKFLARESARAAMSPAAIVDPEGQHGHGPV